MDLREETCVRVVLFDDMRGSTALKERLARRSDEEAFHELRREHDELVRAIIERDGGGEVLKSTGDGLVAVFSRPSVAVERAVELQERLHGHPHLRVRIGIDMGEVKLQREGDRATDVFGLHVDLAARALELASDGHICVTRPVYTDAFSWITKRKIAWKEHGPHRVKAGDPPLDVFEPYNANVTKPLRKLRGEKLATGTRRRAAPAKAAAPTSADGVAVIRPWEMVARDGREFAARGAGAMYWFRVPLGGISYPEGFRSFLQPALENDRITKIRFVLDASHDAIRRVWDDLVLPLVQEWAGGKLPVAGEGDRGRLELSAGGKTLAWVFVDLSREFSPCFKLLVSDLDRDEVTESEAQVFLSTAARTVWLRDGSEHAIRVPDAVLRIRPGTNEALLNALNAVANQWDSLFS